MHSEPCRPIQFPWDPVVRKEKYLIFFSLMGLTCLFENECAAFLSSPEILHVNLAGLSSKDTTNFSKIYLVP